MAETTEKYVLITNLQFVFIGDVRMWCWALLIEEREAMFKPGAMEYRLRGFLTDATLPVFDMALPSAEYTVHNDPRGGRATLCFLGTLRYTDGDRPPPDVTLIAMKLDTDINFDVISGPQKESPIMRVWSVLECRTRQFWQRGTNMPIPMWSPV